MKALGFEVMHVYGLTETTGAITIMMPEDHDPKKGKLRSCGKALKGVELKVVDENGNDLKTGEIGEVISKSDIQTKQTELQTEYNNNTLHKALSSWVIMLSPLAPHLAEELWKILGYKSMVAEQMWPKYENKFLNNDNKKNKTKRH